MLSWTELSQSSTFFQSPTLTTSVCTLAILAVFAAYFHISAANSYGNAKIVDLRIYPIKSCKGLSVNCARITARGLIYDRLFMIVDGDNKFVTQRTSPELSLVETSIEQEKLTISAPNMPTLSFPLAEPDNRQVQRVTVWGEQCDAVEVGHDVSEWFQQYLGIDGCKLVRMKDGFERATSRKYSKSGQTGFADGFPFLLISVASLGLLNNLLDKPVSMKNFRPNIIVDGVNAHEEDTWREVVGGGTRLSVVKHCSRCKMPNVLPDLGVMPEDLPVTAALSTYRTGTHLNFPKALANVTFFGVQLDNHNVEGGLLRVGDTIATR